MASNIRPATMQQTPETIWQNVRIGRRPQQSIKNKPKRYPVWKLKFTSYTLQLSYIYFAQNSDVLIEVTIIETTNKNQR